MQGAQNLSAFLSPHLEAPNRRRTVPSSVAYGFLVFPAVGAVLQRFYVLPSGPDWLPLAGQVACLIGAATSFAFAASAAERHRKQSLAVMADLAHARSLGLVARRIDTTLAGIYSRAMPRPDECKMVAAILGHLERDLTALGQTSTGRRIVAGEAIRRHERIVLRLTRTTVRLENGRVLAARIKDVSLSGLAVETELPAVELQATAMVGSRPARAVRSCTPVWRSHFSNC